MIDNTEGERVLSKDNISCLGHDEFGMPVGHPHRDLDILFWSESEELSQLLT